MNRFHPTLAASEEEVQRLAYKRTTMSRKVGGLLGAGSISLLARACVTVLHRRVDGGRLADMDELHKTHSSLDLERANLRKVPTWPWNPGTLRSLVAALLLPILIWLMQHTLQRLLG